MTTVQSAALGAINQWAGQGSNLSEILLLTPHFLDPALPVVLLRVKDSIPGQPFSPTQVSVQGLAARWASVKALARESTLAQA
jgi:hypothetical protein